MIRLVSSTFVLVLLSLISFSFAHQENSKGTMKLANLTAVYACPPICVSAYPKLLIASDSTTATYDGGPLQGWGRYIGEYVNLSVMNLARNGRSTRSYMNEGLWNALLSLTDAGDFVVIEMGHNDDGDIRKANNTRAYRNTLPGTGDETAPFKVLGSNRTEIVHTFGWYLKRMIIDVRDRGGVPIISGMTPRNTWRNTTAGNTLNTEYKFADYAKTVAEELLTEYIDHTKYSVQELQNLGQAEAKKLFPADNTHTNPEGARLNAETFVQALRCADSEMVQYLNDDGRAVQLPGC